MATRLKEVDAVLIGVGLVGAILGRELTKAHEEIIRGTLSQALAIIDVPRGEFVVAVNIGQKPEHTPSEPPSEQRIVDEFASITAVAGLSRRKAVAAVARRLGLPPNTVYETIEKHKKSGK